MKLKHSNSKKDLSAFTNAFSTLGNQDDSSMDWSSDIPLNTSPLPCVPPAGVYVLLPHVPLPQGSTYGNNMSASISVDTVILNYSNSQPSVPDLWDGDFYALSIFESKKSLNKNITNITTSLKRIEKHIMNHPVDKVAPYGEFTVVAKGLWDLINAIYMLK